MSRRISAAVLFVAAVTAAAWIKAEPPKPSADSLATVLPQAETEQVGMSVERLQRIHSPPFSPTSTTAASRSGHARGASRPACSTLSARFGRY